MFPTMVDDDIPEMYLLKNCLNIFLCVKPHKDIYIFIQVCNLWEGGSWGVNHNRVKVEYPFNRTE